MNNEKNERYLLMNIFNNMNDVYAAITDYDQCIFNKLCSNDNFKLMQSIINFSNCINVELNTYKISDENKKRKVEFI